ncbi:MAG: helix-turn-helix transcriptional regulator [Clostridia bacterium]|nr:helix-turn-helix transcriptional regulator [Clostridia bacterium]
MDVKTIIQSEISLHHVSGLVSPAFWSETYHAHDHAEIFIHIRGQMQLFIENNIYYHSGNEIRVYAPQEYHFGKSDTTQEMEWYQISLAPSFLKAYPALANKIINRPKGFENVFISRKHETIVSLMEEIYKKQSSPIGEHYLFANILKVLCLLNETENNIEVKMGKNECLQSIIETIHNHLPQIKTVETIAQLTHFSPSYIHQLFKKYLNITPHKYILTKKLSYAKELLSQGATISQACFCSGFDDYANFITKFRKYFGVTPKNHQKANH